MCSPGDRKSLDIWSDVCRTCLIAAAIASIALLLFSIRVPSCGKAPISVRLVEQATRDRRPAHRENASAICAMRVRIETKVVSVLLSPDRQTLAAPKSLHRPDRRDLSPASRDWRTCHVFMIQIAMYSPRGCRGIAHHLIGYNHRVDVVS